ncbi:MAG: JAB domain-containing protein [Sphaerochaetaceae bacterium]
MCVSFFYLLYKYLWCHFLRYDRGLFDSLRERATAVVVAHNHPSGKLQPSSEDLNVTRRLL